VKISIIILTYNGRHYLEACLNSVAAQDYPASAYELIVADNHSVDGSAEFVASNFPEVKVMSFKENHGFAKGNNLATASVGGELLVYLNQDTVVDRQWLSGLVDGLERYGLDACCSTMILPRNKDFECLNTGEAPKKFYYYDLNRMGYVSQHCEDKRGQWRQTRFLTGASFIIARRVLDRVGYLFDEHLGTYNEDLDLSLRLIRNGFKIGAVSNSVFYHLSSFNLKVSRYNVWKNLQIIRNRFIVHWKDLPASRFLGMCPALLCSQSHKVFKRCRQIECSFLMAVMLSASMIPLSIAGFGKFLVFLIKTKHTHRFMM